MKIAITGSTGFTGRALSSRLTDRGFEIIRITRETLSSSSDELAATLEGTHVVINLAGASIAKRWTDAYKEEILNSRVDTTRKLVEAINRMQTRPSLLISASATGFYADEGCHNEASGTPGKSFLSEVCRQWEAEAMKAEQFTRVVILRMGVVLGEKGGVLSKLEPTFRLGLGAKIGTGNQHFSFIHLSDLIDIMLLAIDSAEMKGIYNAVTPYPSFNKEFTAMLGKAFGQPAGLTVPAWVMKMVLAEGAQVVLGGQCVLPARLLEAGYRFRYPTLQNALFRIYR